MPIQDAYRLAGAVNPLDLNRIYAEEDQRLMKSGDWDYDNSALLINRVKETLSVLDLDALSEEEREWCREILWFWHHHAISCAIRKRDAEAARLHGEMALYYQGDEHPNQITRLLYLLVKGEFAQAEEWSRCITDEVEKETAAYLLESYPTWKF